MKKEPLKSSRIEFRTTQVIVDLLDRLSDKMQLTRTSVIEYLIRKESEKRK